MSIEGVIRTLQILLIVGPILAYVLAKRIALGLMKKDRSIALHGYESGRIVRLPGGEYVEVHKPITDYERWELVSYQDYEPLKVRPNANGKITAGQHLRSGFSRWFFQDRIAPVDQKELQKALQEQH